MVKLEKDEEGEFPSDKNSANNFPFKSENIFKASRLWKNLPSIFALSLLELHNLIDECVVDLVLLPCIKLVSKKVFVNRY